MPAHAAILHNLILGASHTNVTTYVCAIMIMLGINWRFPRPIAYTVKAEHRSHSYTQFPLCVFI
jgi:hypothetical protein